MSQLYTYTMQPQKTGTRLVPKLTPVNLADGLEIKPANPPTRFRPIVTINAAYSQGILELRTLAKNNACRIAGLEETRNTLSEDLNRKAKALQNAEFDRDCFKAALDEARLARWLWVAAGMFAGVLAAFLAVRYGRLR